MKLLEGIVVLDFCQFLSGPSAAMRLSSICVSARSSRTLCSKRDPPAAA